MSFTLGLVGDLMFSHRVREAQERATDPAEVLREVAPLLRACDLRIANFETPISVARRAVPGARPDYWALPAAADAVAAAGFQVVTLANNHVLDFGREGVERTLRELDRVGIAWCGLAGEGIGERVEARVQAPDGGVLAVLAYCGMRNVAVRGRPYWTVPPDLVRVRRDIRRALDSGCAVLVVIHEGGGPWPSPELDAAARGALLAGASVVAVHHAHVLGGIERVGDGLIAWGLGNFLAATNNFLDERREGMVLRCTLDGRRVVAYEFYPTWVTEAAVVVPAPPEVEVRVRSRIEHMSRAMAAGEGPRRYRDSITPDRVARRLVEAVREALRGGGRNLWPTIRSLRPRHARLVWQGLQALARRIVAGPR